MAGKFVVSKGKDGQNYFALKAGNGETILQSEGYKARNSCEIGIDSVRSNSANVDRFHRRTSRDGKYYFVLKSSNGQEVGRSRMYKSESGCRNGMASVARNAPGADVVDDKGR